MPPAQQAVIQATNARSGSRGPEGPWEGPVDGVAAHLNVPKSRRCQTTQPSAEGGWLGRVRYREATQRCPVVHVPRPERSSLSPIISRAPKIGLKLLLSGRGT